MLEGVSDLTLSQLNETTQARVDMEYNRKVHSELGTSRLERYLKVKDVGRPCPSSEQLLLAFTAEVRRTQRRSDGTITIEGVRFEIPSRYGHFAWVSVRVASWDLNGLMLGPDNRPLLFEANFWPSFLREDRPGQPAQIQGEIMNPPQEDVR